MILLPHDFKKNPFTQTTFPQRNSHLFLQGETFVWQICLIQLILLFQLKSYMA